MYNGMTILLFNSSFSQAIKTCSHILRSMPTAQKKFVFYTEHVLRFGSEHLKSRLKIKMPFWKVCMLDILGITFFLLFITYTVSKYLLCHCYHKYIVSDSSIKGEKQKRYVITQFMSYAH